MRIARVHSAIESFDIAPSVPQIFSADRRAKLRDRALGEGGFARADFLHRIATEQIIDRLDDTPWRFSDIAVFGAAGAVLSDALSMRPGVKSIREFDIAARFAECAPDRSPNLDHTREVGGAGQPVLPEKSVDLIISQLELHAVNDPLGALIQWRMALRPNGLLIASLFAGDTLQELRSLRHRHAFAARVYPFGEIRDLGGLLGRSGFALPVADIERLTIWSPDLSAILRDIRDIGESSALAQAPVGFSRRALQRASADYQRAFGREGDGKVRATVEIGFLTGWRPGPNMPQAKTPGSATVSLTEALAKKN